MKIEAVMSTEVVTVSPDTPLKTVAEELVEHRISGMPVVNDAGEVLGVISEADLIAKEGRSFQRPAGLRERMFHHDAADPTRKLNALVAGEAMTSPAITTPPYRSVGSVARKMLELGINRLPVVRDGQLVGIVTRADLVRAFARSDEEVLEELRDQVRYWLALAGDSREIEVRIGAEGVTLAGEVSRRSSAESLPALVETVPGVVEVHSELTWIEDDSEPRRGPTLLRVS
jgi:CBS domain-containing protein